MERLTRADPEAMKEERQRERGGGESHSRGAGATARFRGGGGQVQAVSHGVLFRIRWGGRLRQVRWGCS